MSRTSLHHYSTFMHRDRVFQVKPEFEDMASLFQEIHFLFLPRNYSQVTRPTKHLHGFRGSKLQSLCLHGKYFQPLHNAPSPHVPLSRHAFTALYPSMWIYFMCALPSPLYTMTKLVGPNFLLLIPFQSHIY